MLGEMLDNVHAVHPLVHNITNYVTINDCANMVLACGGSPIMANCAVEAAEITSGCTSLNINIGMLNESIAEAMLEAGKKANELHHPIVLDPVGLGASSFRRKVVKELLEKVSFTVIRGNLSEIKALRNTDEASHGVDAAENIRPDDLPAIASFAAETARMLHTIIAITGRIDVISDGTESYAVYNGHPMMAKVSGTGCALSALIGAFIGANPEEPLYAVTAAISAMGYCGELAFERLQEKDGNASYRTYIIDAMYNLTGTQLEEGAKYEML